MELKDFVAEAIKQVIDGVKAGQEHARKVGAVVNPDNQLLFGNPGFALLYRETAHDNPERYAQIIEFDVAVTTTQDIQAKGSGKIFVGFAEVGSQVQSDRQRNAENRIKFSIPVCLPYQNQK
jgi:hypothetical protein